MDASTAKAVEHIGRILSQHDAILEINRKVVDLLLTTKVTVKKNYHMRDCPYNEHAMCPENYNCNSNCQHFKEAKSQ